MDSFGGEATEECISYIKTLRIARRFTTYDRIFKKAHFYIFVFLRIFHLWNVEKKVKFGVIFYGKIQVVFRLIFRQFHCKKYSRMFVASRRPMVRFVFLLVACY